MVILATESGVAVHQMYGEGLMKIVSHERFNGFVKCVSITGNIKTSVVLQQNSTAVFQNSPLDFGVELCSSICKFYCAIGYFPPHGARVSSQISFTDSIKEADALVTLLTAMQVENTESSPGRSSFRGEDGMPASGTVKCIQSTVESWRVLQERLEQIEKGSSARVYPPSVACEIEHFFGFVTKKGQGNNQNQQEYIIAKRRHLVDYKFKMADVPFCQHEKEKVCDKGYQDIQHGRFPLIMDSLRKVISHSNIENLIEVDQLLTEDDEIVLKKVYLLSKSVPRQTNRAKWREKSGYKPNMLTDSSSPGLLEKNDLVFCLSKNDELVYLIVQKEFLLDDINSKVPVYKVGSSSEKQIRCSKLLGDKGQIFTVPSSLYTLDDEGSVTLDDVAFKHLEILLTPSSETHSDWALLLEYDEESDKVQEKQM